MRRHLDLRATLIALVVLGSCIAPAAAEAQGYAYYALTPCRLLDTRVTAGAGRRGHRRRKETGYREVVAVDVFTSEDEAGWLGSLLSLVARGLNGVKLTTSDARPV